jgi:hypothetical protein
VSETRAATRTRTLAGAVSDASQERDRRGSAHTSAKKRGGRRSVERGATTRNIKQKRAGVLGAAAHSGPQVAPKA